MPEAVLETQELKLVPQVILSCYLDSTHKTTLEDAFLLNDGGFLAAVEALCPSCYETYKSQSTECEECETIVFPAIRKDAFMGIVVMPYRLCEACRPICSDCSGAIDRELTEAQQWDNRRGVYNTVEVCQVCLDNNYTYCSNCRGWHDIDHSTDIANGALCRSCMENYRSCDTCGAVIHVDNMQYSDSGGYCPSCYREDDDDDDDYADNRSDYVHSYSYSPSLRFYDSEGIRVLSPEGLFHGIELEVGWNSGYTSEYANRVNDALGNICYLKEDGSIADAGVNGGFEIVTQPCQLDYYRNHMQAICDNSIPGLLSHNAGEGLGLHISVNRNELSNHAIARICAFIGADRNEDWLVRLARRKSDQWARIIKKTCVADTLDSNGNVITNNSRYEAVNLQNSSHIEFRLFRGTLKYSSLMLCIEFVNALCMWCKDNTVQVSDYQSALVFLEFAKMYPAQYPHLIEFLCNRI